VTTQPTVSATGITPVAAAAAEAGPAATRPLRRSPSSWQRGGGLSAFLFAIPLLVVFGVFSWWPIISAFIMSLQKTNLVDAPTWVGLDNFREVLTDPLLPTIIRNTAWFAFLALIFGYPIPLVAAVLMSELRRRKGVYSVLVYLPVVVPPVVAVLLWKVFYDPRPQGVFNTVLGWFGLGPYSWLADKTLAMPSLVLEATWAAAGGTVIIYLAALIAVPAELYDAAEVDGASVWNKIWHVTLPQLRGVLFITLILQILGTAQVFLEPFLFTNGGPNHATETIMLRVYNLAFANLGNNYGQATALSLLLALFLALLSLIYFRVTKPWSTT
jgi:multiple sugar transport system permease protein